MINHGNSSDFSQTEENESKGKLSCFTDGWMMFNMSKEHAIITLDNANVNSDEENAHEPAANVIEGWWEVTRSGTVDNKSTWI